MRKHLWLAILAVGCAAKQAPANTTPVTSTEASPVAVSADAAGDRTSLLLSAALNGSHRSEANRARDVYRHPQETLAFFGVQSTQQVIELWPGRGWYTELLAPLLRDEGKLFAVAENNKYLPPYRELLASQPDLYSKVEVVEVTPPSQLALGPDGSADVVLTFRNLHNWITAGTAKPLHEAIFKVLKPGGVYGVVEHRALAGSSAEESAKSGYISEQAAIELVTAAGFVLDAQSEINANKSDTKDHPKGVWSLPPSLAGGDVDREKFVAIGESDRMTLRFKKPL